MPEKEAVIEYAVQCANAIPEIIEVLRETEEYMGALLAAVCDECAQHGTECCHTCKANISYEKVSALLEKLEDPKSATSKNKLGQTAGKENKDE